MNESKHSRAYYLVPGSGKSENREKVGSVGRRRCQIPAGCRKDDLCNLANLFTGSKTQRLETELAQSREEVKTLKEQAEHTSKTHSNEMWNLRQQLDRQKEQNDSIVRGHQRKWT